MARNGGSPVCHCEPFEEGEATLDGPMLLMPSYNRERMERLYSVYLLTNFTNSVIYTGVTSNLKRRIYEHREKLVPGFTNKYNVWKLVYFEVADDRISAIEREKQIKGGSRRDKEELVRSTNPQWRDLYEEL
jgi:putative endonuclease